MSGRAPDGQRDMTPPINLLTALNTEGRIDVAGALGSSAMSMFIYDLAPGEGASPYHYEYEEEWLLVLAGSVVIREPAGERVLERGDLVRFPAGPDGAHKAMNRGAGPARLLMFSRAQLPAVSVYPDSNKLGVWPGNEADDLIVLRDAGVPWSHGEEGWDRAD